MKTVIIDGHNLIPKIPGLSLADLDDEEKLVAQLQVYARVERRRVEVFFDDAPAGRAETRSFGTIRAHFVPKASEADEAIRAYLNGLGKTEQKTITVVSSDRMVQAYARERHVQVMPSENFAARLEQVQATELARTAKKGQSTAAEQPAADNLGEWYDIFGLDPQQAERPLPLSKAEVRQAGKRSSFTRSAGTQSANTRGAAEKPRKHHGFKKKE